MTPARITDGSAAGQHDEERRGPDAEREARPPREPERAEREDGASTIATFPPEKAQELGGWLPRGVLLTVEPLA